MLRPFVIHHPYSMFYTKPHKRIFMILFTEKVEPQNSQHIPITVKPKPPGKEKKVIIVTKAWLKQSPKLIPPKFTVDLASMKTKKNFEI